MQDKRYIAIILIAALLQVVTGTKSYAFFPPDTIPPPPPAGAGPLTGPDYSCIGDTASYSVDVPLGCSCQWTVNGTIQPDTVSPFSIIWPEPGYYAIGLVIICDTVQSDPDSIISYVGTSIPTPIQGPGVSCEGSLDFYMTTVGPGEICRWTVDGILQSTTSTTLGVTWQEIGQHLIEVRADGECGLSDPVYKNVSVNYIPDVDLGNDTILQPGQTLLLDAGNPGCSYLWSTGATTQMILVTVSGTYSVQVSNSCGIDSDEIEVTILVGLAEPEQQNQLALSASGRKVLLLEIPGDIQGIEIFDMAGRSIFEGEPREEISLPLPGIYMMKIISARLVTTYKFIIP